MHNKHKLKKHKKAQKTKNNEKFKILSLSKKKKKRLILFLFSSLLSKLISSHNINNNPLSFKTTALAYLEHQAKC